MSIRSIRLFVLAVAASWSGVGAQSPAEPQRYDLVLRGGRIVDPVAGSMREAHVGIREGRIAAIGEFEVAAGSAVLEVSGLCIAPGFVDVHTHVDSDIVRQPLAENFLRMGVTTIVTGNCGSSVRDLAVHFGRLERGGIGVNYGSLVGLGTVRSAVLGTQNRRPDEKELAAMRDLVEQGMRAGAFGVSTGLIYVPGVYADREELTALTAVAGRFGGIYVSHMRYEGDEVLEGIDEALAIGKGAGTPVHVSHIKCTGKPNHGRAREVLERLARARGEGMVVTADQYAYDASSTGLEVLFPADELAVGREPFAERLRDDAEFQQRIHAALLQKMDAVGFGDFRYARIASAKGNEALNGLLFPEASERHYGKSDRGAQADLAIELLIDAGSARVGMVYHTMAEQDVETYMREPWIAVASDSGLRSENGVDRPHPRGSGNNPRVLARYVRERKVVDLPTAVAKMTSVPARTFGIADRGLLSVGAWADLVVFDPETVADTATWSEPVRRPEGIVWVLVNGQVAVHRGEVTGIRAGHVLRR